MNMEPFISAGKFYEYRNTGTHIECLGVKDGKDHLVWSKPLSDFRHMSVIAFEQTQLLCRIGEISEKIAGRNIVVNVDPSSTSENLKATFTVEQPIEFVHLDFVVKVDV